MPKQKKKSGLEFLKLDALKITEKVSNFCKLCSGIADKLPKKDDTSLTKVIKIGAAFEKIAEKIKNELPSVTSYLKTLYKNEKKSSTYAHFFTLLLNEFKQHLEKEPFGAETVIYHFINDKQQKLFAFVCTDTKNSYFIDTIYFNDREQMFYFNDLLWAKYKNKALVTVLPNNNKNIKLITLVPIENDVLPSFCTNFFNKRYGNIYLLNGLPGSGKSTYVHSFATSTNKRILQIHSTFIDESYGFLALNNICWFLKPDLVFIDDFDRTNYRKGNADVLLGTDEAHKTYNDILYIFTCNYISKIEKALLRPGRIDHVINFKPLDNEQKREYLQNHYSVELVNYILQNTENFTIGDLKFVVESTKETQDLNTIENILNDLKELKNYQQQAEEFDV